MLLSAEVEPASVWRGSSAAGVVFNAIGAFLSFRTVATHGGVRARAGVLLAVNIPLALVTVLQFWNVLALGAFWPVFALLIAWFALACFSFTRLLYAPA